MAASAYAPTKATAARKLTLLNIQLLLLFEATELEMRLALCSVSAIPLALASESAIARDALNAANTP
jgi:hypothetical protein